jgi:16S rRNA G966 N2-methylase RsmD
MDLGIEGLMWPRVLSRYNLQWPNNLDSYSHYVRSEVATKDEAKLTAVAMDALQWLKNVDLIDADLIFIDPPFEQANLLEEALLLINTKTKIDTPPIIYVESSSKLDIDGILQKLSCWKVEKQLLAGAVRASILMYRKDV